jgi:type IV secretory pathway VirD2 relaxase
MGGFRTVPGFEDLWRPPGGLNRRRPEMVLRPGPAGGDDRARLARLVTRAPEVIVKIAGRTKTPAHLRASLDYITRNGRLEAEDRDGAIFSGRGDIRELADDWSALALADRRRRADRSFSLSIVVSMPAGTDAAVVCDAGRAFAQATFASRFDYVFVLHTDTPRPHVHLLVCARGDSGKHLDPSMADLADWRRSFAEALRDRGVAAEATPRWIRGVTRKAEKTPLRKIRDQHEAGEGAMARVRQAAYREAAMAAFGRDETPRPWEADLLRRQTRVRGLLMAQARLLQGSPGETDRALGVSVEHFVRDLPAPDTQRLALARELRAANARLAPDRGDAAKDRSR